MNKLLEGRIFQLWEYNVSHGTLLIRSPKGASIVHNIDIKFFGVEYLSLPRHMQEVSINNVTNTELRTLGDLLYISITKEKAYVLESKGNRYYVIASGMKIEKNNYDIFFSGL